MFMNFRSSARVLLGATVALSFLQNPVPAHSAGLDKTTTGSVARYASPAGLARKASFGGSVDVKPASSTLKTGLKALDKRDMPTALAARKRLRPGTLERKVLAWAIAVDGRNVPHDTLLSIANDLAEWPAHHLLLILRVLIR